MKINKREVHKSLWIVFVVLGIIGYFVLVGVRMYYQSNSFLVPGEEPRLWNPFLLISTIFYYPELIIDLIPYWGGWMLFSFLLEWFCIRSTSGQKRVRNVLIAEVTVPALLFVSSCFYPSILLMWIGVFGVMGAAQYMRWIYLHAPGKMFKSNRKRRPSEIKI